MEVNAKQSGAEVGYIGGDMVGKYVTGFARRVCFVDSRNDGACSGRYCHCGCL